MNDGIEAEHVLYDDIADIFFDTRHIFEFACKCAGPEQITIETCDLMSSFEQHGREDRAYITAVTRDQDFHLTQLHNFQGARPLSHSVCKRCFSRRVSMHCQKDSC